MQKLFQSCLYITTGLAAMFFTVWFLMHFSAGANPAEGGAKPQAKPAESAKPEPAPPAQPTEPVSSAEPAQPQAQSAEPAPPAQPTEPVSSAEPAKSQAPSAEGTAPPTEQAQPSVQKKPQDPQVDLPKIPEQIQKAASNPDHSINKARTSIKNVNQKFVEVKELMRNYSYESENRRNPFKPPASVGKDLEEDLIPSYPTGQYDLSSIKLIGIKWGSGEGLSSRALFKTPDNIVHSLQKNDRIGRNRAVLYQLREDEVVILEPQAPDLSASADLGSEEDVFAPVIMRLNRVQRDTE